MRALVPLVFVAAIVCPAAPFAQAPVDVISVLATNAIVGPLTTIVEGHNRQSRPPVKVEFDTSPSINRRFAAGTIAGVSVLVAAANTVDQAIKDGRLLEPALTVSGIKENYRRNGKPHWPQVIRRRDRFESESNDGAASWHPVPFRFP